ncbi:hypothetical protein Droror1_Dr00009157 [Drosera rotundifolia]
MKKISIHSRNSEDLPSSPWTPCLDEIRSTEINGGWSSERVPVSKNNDQRRVRAAALLPFGKRTLPSKWDEAERWISSPTTENDVARRTPMNRPKRLPRSKSGPLGPSDLVFYGNCCSPVLPELSDGSTARNSLAVEEDVAANGSGSCLPLGEDDRASADEWLEPLIHPTPPTSQGVGIENHSEIIKDGSSSRDETMQLSLEPSSGRRSSRERASLSSSHPQLEVRDVKVDEEASSYRSSRERSMKLNRSSSTCHLNLSFSALNGKLSKFQREEENIDAWENLQKAKAEAAIRKLEMKLEEKKSTSMARIMKKLKQSQTIAQEMRSSISAGRGQQISRASSSIANFYIRFRIQLIKCCITC